MIDDPASGGWHVDKRIPAALIVTILLGIFAQTIAGVWWAATIQAEVANIRQRVDTAADLGPRLGKVEIILDRVERKLDKLAP